MKTRKNRAPPHVFAWAQFFDLTGMILFGLMRGSWPGLALASVGGLLIYSEWTPCRIPSRSDAVSDGRLRGTYRPLPVANQQSLSEEAVDGFGSTNVDVSTPAHSPSTLTEMRAEELTREEHAEAEVLAYFRSIERGGGQVPPYDHLSVVADFVWAAECLRNQRVGG